MRNRGRELKRTIADLRQKASRSELLEQNLREVRMSLDMQVAKYSRIHKYAISSLDAKSQDDFHNTITAGIVDVFELEVGGYFVIDWLRNKLVLVGNTNFDYSEQNMILPEDLVLGRGAWKFTQREAVCESPVRSQLWADMDLAHVVFMPVYDNAHQFSGLLMGGVSNSGLAAYGFEAEGNLALFMVYCQLMNGLINNREAAKRVLETAKSTSSFLADLGHDIRIPLNAIISMAQLAGRSGEMNEIRRCVRQIVQSSLDLSGVLNDALDVSQK